MKCSCIDHQCRLHAEVQHFMHSKINKFSLAQWKSIYATIVWKTDPNHILEVLR